MRALTRKFYDRDTKTVAGDLLGMHLVRRYRGRTRVGRIVEVEAYLGPKDLAAHSARGLTERTKVMFGPPGHAYVYMIYGMYFCMNVVTEKKGHASAVLIRAVEPVGGISERTDGPGRLCRAMKIDRSLNDADLVRGNLFIVRPPRRGRIEIVRRPRIGVDYAGVWAKKRLRYYIKGNPYVSKK